MSSGYNGLLCSNERNHGRITDLLSTPPRHALCPHCGTVPLAPTTNCVNCGAPSRVVAAAHADVPPHPVPDDTYKGFV